MERLKIGIGITSDTHGLFDGRHDLSALEDTFHIIRSTHDYTVFIDNGDSLQGSTGLHYYGMNPEEQHPFPQLASRLGYNAFIPGNHDFDYGWPLFKALHEQSDIPWLCANLLLKENAQPLLAPYKIYSAGPVKIALIGLTINVPFSDPDFENNGLMLMDEVKALEKTTAYIAENEAPHLMIVSYHGGMAFDGPLEPNKGKQLAALKNIDLLITGHQHQIICDDNTYEAAVIQTGVHGERAGLATFEFEQIQGENWQLINRRLQLLRTDQTFLTDDSFYSRNEADKISRWFNEPLTDRLHPAPPVMHFQRKESPLSRWVHDVLAKEMNIHCTLLTYSVTSMTFTDKPLTRETIFQLCPYPERIYIFRFTRQEILNILETGASMYKGDGTWALSDEWKNSHPLTYQFAVLSGLNYVLDCRKAPRERASVSTSMNRDMTVAVSGFIANRATKYEEVFKGKESIAVSADTLPIMLEKGIQNRIIPDTLTDVDWEVII